MQDISYNSCETLRIKNQKLKIKTSNNHKSKIINQAVSRELWASEITTTDYTGFFGLSVQL